MTTLITSPTDVLKTAVNVTRAEIAECNGDEFALTLARAAGIQRLREAFAVPEIADLISNLQGTPLGFRTDRERGYPADVVRDCCVTALIRGLKLTDNEWNIIGGNLYVTIEGIRGLLGRMGVAFDARIGNPVKAASASDAKRADGGGEQTALVDAHVEWTSRHHGSGKMMFTRHATDTTAEPIDMRIAVRVNKGMGIDAIKSKAECRALKRVYQRITNAPLDDVSTELEPKD